jgi:DNA-binding NarL/FixJ family response regulator
MSTLPFLETLTGREREVFELIGKGKKNTEIAEELGITLNTVRTYSKTIHDKLYIEGRANLAIAAYKVISEGESNGL